MPHYRVVVEARGPLLLGDGLPAGNVQVSRPFVAGSVWRGGLARAILAPLGLWRHHGRRTEDGPLPDAFVDTFLSEPPVRFGFLYPVRQKGERAASLESFPLPLTAFTCKSHKGFKVGGGHGVFDLLLPRLRQAAGGTSSWLSRCPAEGCGERLERFRGFAACGKKTATTCAVKIEPHTFVRVGLNRWTETAEERVLYTLEALVPGSGKKGDAPPICFVGYWTMTEAQWNGVQRLFAQHLPAHNGGYSLHIGTARARGMGEVQLCVPEAPATFPDVGQRLKNFQPRNQAGNPLDPEHLYFSLSLRAPLRVLDRCGRPASELNTETLQPYAPVPPGLTPLPAASLVEQETWSGWSPAWGLPKPVTTALAPGSVLSFRAPAHEESAVVRFLEAAEETGLGERLPEGWGEVRACDPFHITFDAGGRR